MGTNRGNKKIETDLINHNERARQTLSEKKRADPEGDWAGVSYWSSGERGGSGHAGMGGLRGGAGEGGLQDVAPCVGVQRPPRFGFLCWTGIKI